MEEVSGTEEQDEEWESQFSATLAGQPAVHDNYMWKMGEHHQAWKLRFFVLESDVLRGSRLLYFTDATLKHKRGAIDLSTIESVEWSLALSGKISEQTGQGYEIRLHEKGRNARVWLLKVQSAKARDGWAERLCAVLNQPFEKIGPTYDEVQKAEADLDWRVATSKRQRLFVEANVVGYVRLAEAKKVGMYTAFEIQVHTNMSFLFDGRTDFVVYRRFSDFSNLSKVLMTFLPLNRPELPYIPARVYKERFSGAVLEERKWSFNALLKFWIGSQFDPARLPLPLLTFISPMSEKEEILLQSFVVESVTASMGKSPSVVLEEPCEHAEIPPILRSSEASLSFETRMIALRAWLSTHQPTSSLAAKIVEHVGGLVPARRAAVADEISGRVSDPSRLFLVVQAVEKVKIA